jgi:hypothetical protein
MFKIHFKLQRQGGVYERKVYDILSLIGDVGGSNDALFMIG